MKKLLLFFVMMLLPMMANANVVVIDGICYNLISKGGINIAEVTKNPNEDYSGNVVIPESVTFEDVDYSVTSIGSSAFEGCRGLKSVTIPNSVTTIGKSAFYYCLSITSVTIPNSVTTIGSGAFQSCYFLKSVTIPNSVTTIGSSAFYGCESLPSVTIPISVTTIEPYTFCECYGLKSVTIPNNVTSIGELAFWNCTHMESITIPDSVTSIGQQAFSGCRKLTSVSIPNSVNDLGKTAFLGCSSLSKVVISGSIKSIRSYTFSGCSSLISVIIPNSVTSIEGSAFNGCSSLDSVVIGSAVNNIGEKAFSKCSNLETVKCLARIVPNTSDDAFEDSYIEYATLYVPSGSISSYESTSPWNSFNSIVKINMPEHTLTYMVDGEVYKTYEIEEGETITPEEIPTKEGYTFSGWSEIPETMPAHDVTVTGSFSINKYKLTYVVDGEEYKSYEVEYGATITPEAYPTKEGYTFSGWSEIPGTMPANDVTITGSFTINQYQVTYIVDGAIFKTEYVEYDSKLTPPSIPEKEGYSFAWNEYPETMPANDIIITGQYSINKYKLAYTVDGEEYKSYETEYGAAITPEKTPTKEGYTFSGWSEMPATMPAHDVTVSGTFAVNKYKITYIMDNKVYKEVMCEYGATVTPEPQPVGVYDTFEWIGQPETMPAHDVVVYAVYTSGIADALMITQQNVRIYTPNGKKLDKLQKGLNIVVLNDGTVKKVVIK
ncbi:leucine-rich repeat protein [Prevotella communis]|uniref:leucine-rich repeat protein n=1 Tax=Prevotella communis TaxID=2913614 RepID=UPI000AD2E0BB|nr:leucine-rich repeat protein [Prevotella communis]